MGTAPAGLYALLLPGDGYLELVIGVILRIVIRITKPVIVGLWNDIKNYMAKYHDH